MSLELEGLTKRFGDILAVDDVDLKADDEDLLVLVGPSGSGKTTILRMIAGLETESEGDIRINGESVRGTSAGERDIAMVFQNYALYPHMTVRENMGLALTVDGIPKDEVRVKVEEVADTLDISELLDRKPAELSGGQQQRVALGRAIVRDPEVFLMDEPLSNLDAKLRMEMRKELEELHHRLNTTFVYVTHDQTEAMTMGTKIAVLNRGKIQQVGRPETLYDEPKNEFVAGFIGSPSINFMDGDVRRRENGACLDLGPIEYPLPADLFEKVREAGSDGLRLGIRPEDVHITPEGPYEATVNVVEPIGSNVIVYLELRDTELTAVTERERDFHEADTVNLDFPPEKIHLFADGQAIVSTTPP